MKKRIALIIALSSVLFATGCGRLPQADNQSGSDRTAEASKSNISIPDFSYAKDCAQYAEGDPGVKTSGFVNTTETDIDFETVTELASRECTVTWNHAAVFLDTAAQIWNVVFYSHGIPGGCQSVYLDNQGRTVLIVYGE